MHRTIKLLLASLTFTFLYVGSTSVARADSVVITFTNPAQTVVAGSTAIFSGSLTNVSASPVTLFGSLLTLDVVGRGGFQGTLVNLFFEDAFPQLVSGSLTLLPGESTAVIPIFRVETSPRFGEPLPAIASGLFIVSFGDVFIPANQLGQSSWSVTILPNPNAEAVPEPTTMLLLGTGLAGIGVKVYRRRRQPGERSS